MAVELYDLTPLQGWVRKNKPNLSRAAEDLGYMRNGGKRPDPSRVQRELGLKPEHSRKPPKRSTSFEKAAKLARALGADPLDVGL